MKTYDIILTVKKRVTDKYKPEGQPDESFMQQHMKEVLESPTVFVDDPQAEVDVRMIPSND